MDVVVGNCKGASEAARKHNIPRKQNVQHYLDVWRSQPGKIEQMTAAHKLLGPSGGDARTPLATLFGPNSETSEPVIKRRKDTPPQEVQTHCLALILALLSLSLSLISLVPSPIPSPRFSPNPSPDYIRCLTRTLNLTLTQTAS